ncbi:MAG: hypothetical protein EOM55_01560 [Clostridia bacterium]|nr:hypothetical protein [Clostridia bacterium]
MKKLIFILFTFSLCFFISACELGQYGLVFSNIQNCTSYYFYFNQECFEMNVGDEKDVLELEHQTNLNEFENMCTCTSDDSIVNVSEMTITALVCGEAVLSLKNEQDVVLSTIIIKVTSADNNDETGDEIGDPNDDENGEGETGEPNDDENSGGEMGEPNDDETGGETGGETGEPNDDENIDGETEPEPDDENETETIQTTKIELKTSESYFVLEENLFSSTFEITKDGKSFLTFGYIITCDGGGYIIYISNNCLTFYYSGGRIFSVKIYETSNEQNFKIITFTLDESNNVIITFP